MSFLRDPRFQKRLKFYFVGFLLGILLVGVLFRDRFPSNASPEKVRASFREDSLLINGAVKTRIESIGLGRQAFRDSLLNGEFILPTQKDRDPKVFHVRTKGSPGMKVRLRVLGEGRTRAERIRFAP